MLPVTVKSPPAVTLPVVVIASIYALAQYLLPLPKERVLSPSGIKAPEICTLLVLPPPKNIEDVPCILPYGPPILSIIIPLSLPVIEPWKVALFCACIPPEAFNFKILLSTLTECEPAQVKPLLLEKSILPAKVALPLAAMSKEIPAAFLNLII